MPRNNAGVAWAPNPVIAGISSDDPRLLDILRGINKPILSMPEMIGAPKEKSKTYHHAKSYDPEDDGGDTGILETFASGGRRFAYAIAYAKYLLALRIIGESAPHRVNLPDQAVTPRRRGRPAKSGVPESSGLALSASSKN